MKIAGLGALALAALLAAPVPQVAADAGKAELERIRTEKKAWIALNMDLSPAEAEAFWPLYEGYQKELTQINTRLMRVVEAYGAHYRNDTLTDEAARRLTGEWFAVDEAELKLRRAYAERLNKVVPARKATRYLQLESRISIQVRHELAATLPLAGDARLAPRLPK